MERQLQINWSALVEEARQRRKSQKLTQARLAKLAGVSTPTISRFESGKTDIQLSTIMKILKMLGMTDQRNLVFNSLNKAFYDTSRMVVSFIGKDHDKTIPCAISENALDDYFDVVNKNYLKAFIKHHQQIEHEARRKYLSNQQEVDGSILIKSEDFF